MGISKEEADALRHCVAILAPVSPPHERRTMALNVENRISGQKVGLLVFRFGQFGALFHPNDAKKAEKLAQQMQTAADAGELTTVLPPHEKGALVSDLAAWPDCPPIPEESPLRYWLSFMPTPTSEQGTATPERQLDYAMLATPAQLITAFGAMTGMSPEWFRRMKDRLPLDAAVRIQGVRGRNGTPPLLEVFAVLQYLVSPGRRGKKVHPETVWRLLKAHFPKVYAKYEVNAPNAPD